MSSLVRPLSAQGRGRRLAPFAVGMTAALAFLLVDGAETEGVMAARLVAIAIMAVVTLTVAFVPWNRLPAQLEAIPGFGILVVVGLVVAGSGARSAYAPLVLLPLLWFSVYAGQLALVSAIVIANGFLLANVVESSSPVAVGELRAGLLWAVVVTVVPWGLHRFVRDLQHRAALADRDFITELLSRRAWEERLPEELARAKRDGKPLAVVLLDLDEFKQYNDLHGHHAGDALLRQVAIAWGESLRSTDLLARFGGDEYCAALPGCSAADAHARALRLLSSTPTAVGASAGVAEWQEGEAAESLVRRADGALYDAKSRGGHCVAIASLPSD